MELEGGWKLGPEISVLATSLECVWVSALDQREASSRRRSGSVGGDGGGVKSRSRRGCFGCDQLSCQRKLGQLGAWMDVVSVSWRLDIGRALRAELSYLKLTRHRKVLTAIRLIFLPGRSLSNTHQALGKLIHPLSA